MKWLVPLISLTFMSPAFAADIEANKKAVLEFYEAGLNKKDFEAASKYFGPKYIQHNPGAPDGIEGFKSFLTFLRDKFPNSQSNIVRRGGRTESAGRVSGRHDCAHDAAIAAAERGFSRGVQFSAQPHLFRPVQR